MFDFNPTFNNEFITTKRLETSDFEILYDVASDPLIWEQHPNPDSYKRDVFEMYFKGAMESDSAFIVYDSKTHQVIGSTRYYDYDETKSHIAIGYTFFARTHWGSTYNHALKYAMITHAFKFVNAVIFHIGAENIRSQKSITKLGAQKIAEKTMSYYGEAEKLNFIYQVQKEN